MAGSTIYLVGDPAHALQRVSERPYDAETDLQALLARYPDLLGGEQITPEDPRRWLLIQREMGIPSRADGGNTWSIDHLFVDQDGIPTFVECKRATDTRIRREVVAQLLEYVANATAYWPPDRLRQEAAATHGGDTALDDRVQALMLRDDAAEVSAFWDTVADNLRAGRVRLLFVADETPRELRRLAEFLNAQMPAVEVLAVEVKQFVGVGNVTALVSRVLGVTEQLIATKTGARSRQSALTPDTALERCSPATRPILQHLVARYGTRLVFEYGARMVSVRSLQLRADGSRTTVLFICPPDRIELYLGQLPLSESERAPLRHKLQGFAGIEEAGAHTLRVVATAANAAAIVALLDQYIERVEALATARRDAAVPALALPLASEA